MKKVDKNIDQFEEAYKCWLEPYMCIEVADKIFAKL